MKINDSDPYGTVEYKCDCKDHDEMAHGSLNMWFWYGSKHDMKQGTLHVCDKCADEVIEYLKNKFKIEKFLTKIEEF